jgi:UDP-N-acetylglucosamine 2-epimerase
MRIVTVVGARPQFIKVAPVSRALRREHREILVHTGQHYDDAMSATFFRELDLPEPDYNLEVGSGSHGRQTGRMLEAIESVLQVERPDWVLVYGDTNSTLAGALAAAKLDIPVAHVEAGVRSYNRAMAEEVNRTLTDRVARLLFCPTPSSVANLRREGITEGVRHVGDVMLDVLLTTLPVALGRSTILADLKLQPDGYVLLTIHRAENVDDAGRLRRLVAALRRVEGPVVFPVHPRTRSRLEALGADGDLGSLVQLLPPAGYLDTLTLQAQARAVLTDSGGVQREAAFLGVPCLILRPETEWPELVELGASRLESGPDLLPGLPKGDFDPAPVRAVFGDGLASEAIARALTQADTTGPPRATAGP